MENSKHVFISYKVEDFDKAIAVKNHLEENYITCWMAPMSIRGGMSYAQEIPQAIQECGVFVLILTEIAQQSKWVPREVDQAINCGKIIMPYRIENCPLRNDFSFYLTNVQHYDAYRNPQEALERMTSDIQKVLNIEPPIAEEDEKVPEPEIKTEVPVASPKTKQSKKEKKPKEKKKRKPIIPIILGSVLLAILLLVVILLPNKVNIAGTKFKTNAYSLKVENVTLTQNDVNNFSKFDDLGTISLTNCTIEAQDLSPLATEKLYTLELINCNITDEQISSIDFSTLGKLSEFCVSGSPELTDLSRLRACSDRLYRLNISDTNIKDFHWLKSLDKLKILSADRCGLQDTSFLETMIYLEELSLSGNEIYSLSGLNNTSKLSTVDLSCNHLTDVNVLSQSNASLERVYLSDNAISDLSCLSDAIELQTVYVNDNFLKDLDWLQGRTSLKKLSASNNNITDISGLVMIGSPYLNLSDNRLETIEEGDITFEAYSYPVVNFNNNNLKEIHLQENCTFTQLALLGNPDFNLSSLKGLDGWTVLVEFPSDVSLQTLKDIQFDKLCMIGCPLNRQVEIEDGLNNEQLIDESEALKMIAEKAEEYQY